MIPKAFLPKNQIAGDTDQLSIAFNKLLRKREMVNVFLEFFINNFKNY